jgi:hypothetical protein
LQDFEICNQNLQNEAAVKARLESEASPNLFMVLVGFFCLFFCFTGG